MSRTLIVGDVHGCARELERLLDAVRFACGDVLVFVGDVVAKGPDSLGVLDIVRRTGAILVRGNHEEKILSWKHRKPKDDVHVSHEHALVARSLRDVDWTLLETSSLWLDLPKHGARVVHAGVVPGKPVERTHPPLLMNIRTLTPDGTPSARVGSALWGARYRGPPHVIFGHDATPGLQLHPWATGLDTGCVYGGALTAMVLGPRTRIPFSREARRKLLVSVPAERAYVPMRAHVA